MKKNNSSPIYSHALTHGQIAKTDNIDIWYETFGDKKDPAMLLIMGGLCQGILWPKEFCELLAQHHFYVIRYDHRDCGLSSCFDFQKKPYTLLDMSQDAVELLNYLQIKKAHLFGYSMGGPIAELIAVHFPERVHSLTLMATSSDFRPYILAYDGMPPEQGTSILSSPKVAYLDLLRRYKTSNEVTEEEKIERKLSFWRLFNGSRVLFEEEKYREIYRECIQRDHASTNAMNHLLVIKRSEILIRNAPSLVKTPTLIFHGSEDPVLPPDHGDALAAIIYGSTYCFVPNMGHILNCQFYDTLIAAIVKHTQSTL